MKAVSERVHNLQTLAACVRALVAAQIASERAAGMRAAVGPGGSRAAMTTANARWMRNAEDRDRKQAELEAALVKCGFTTAEEGTCKSSLQVAAQEGE